MDHSATRPAPGAATRHGHRLELAGEVLWLLPERALWWPRRHTLLVADVHLGKGAALRRQGVAIPAGASADDLERLGALVKRHAARRLLVLGDFFHTRPSPSEPLVPAFAAFREQHPALVVEVIAGNHDRPGHTPEAFGIGWLAEGAFERPFVLRHVPGMDPRGPVLAGHVHPVAVLRAGRERARLPVFQVSETLIVLPAFGGLTGGWTVTAGPGERLYACAPDAVLPL